MNFVGVVFNVVVFAKLLCTFYTPSLILVANVGVHMSAFDVHHPVQVCDECGEEFCHQECLKIHYEDNQVPDFYPKCHSFAEQRKKHISFRSLGKLMKGENGKGKGETKTKKGRK